MEAKDILIDVIARSKKHWLIPIQGLLAYATSENFLGRVVDGYLPEASQVCLLSRKAAERLCCIQNQLNKQGAGLFIQERLGKILIFEADKGYDADHLKYKLLLRKIFPWICRRKKPGKC